MGGDAWEMEDAGSGRWGNDGGKAVHGGGVVSFE